MSLIIFSVLAEKRLCTFNGVFNFSHSNSIRKNNTAAFQF